MKTSSNNQRLRIAAVQMSSGPDVSKNLAQARELLERAVERGAEWVAFPENFALFADTPEQVLEVAESLKTSFLVETLQEWAAENDVWILGGSLPLKKGKAKPTQSSVLVDPDGECVAQYDKIHLFDAETVDSQGLSRSHQESTRFSAGKKPVLAETPWGLAGLSICYDLRFPELYRMYSEKGAALLFVPSAFTEVTGKAHWDVLTRARAIENQCYVIAPAQWGENGKQSRTHGHTRIVDPWGRILAEQMAGPGVVVAQLDFAELEKVRGRMPTHAHRKL